MTNGRQRAGGITRGVSMAGVLACVLMAWPALAGRNFTGEAAPDFALKSLAGTNQRLSEYQGNVVLLTFWVPSCGACREQLSQLNDVQARMSARGLRVLSVSIEKKRRAVEDMARGLDLDFPVLLDSDKQVARLYDPGKMPLTLLIDPAGTVRAVREGYRGEDLPALTAELEQLLADYGPLTDQG
jgi:peroxiredoxin